jgi:hypothetical protein
VSPIKSPNDIQVGKDLVSMPLNAEKVPKK